MEVAHSIINEVFGFLLVLGLSAAASGIAMAFFLTIEELITSIRDDRRR
jgi:hypothetical protein